MFDRMKCNGILKLISEGYSYPRSSHSRFSFPLLAYYTVSRILLYPAGLVNIIIIPITPIISSLLLLLSLRSDRSNFSKCGVKRALRLYTEGKNVTYHYTRNVTPIRSITRSGHVSRFGWLSLFFVCFQAPFSSVHFENCALFCEKISKWNFSLALRRTRCAARRNSTHPRRIAPTNSNIPRRGGSFSGPDKTEKKHDDKYASAYFVSNGLALVLRVEAKFHRAEITRLDAAR